LVGSTAAGLVNTILQEVYREYYGISIKQFDPRLLIEETEKE
jgi:hypothetical protein